MVNQVMAGMVGMVIRFHSLRSAQNQPLEDPGLGYFSIGANHVGGRIIWSIFSYSYLVVWDYLAAILSSRLSLENSLHWS